MTIDPGLIRVDWRTCLHPSLRRISFTDTIVSPESLPQLEASIRQSHGHMKLELQQTASALEDAIESNSVNQRLFEDEQRLLTSLLEESRRAEAVANKQLAIAGEQIIRLRLRTNQASRNPGLDFDRDTQPSASGVRPLSIGDAAIERQVLSSSPLPRKREGDSHSSTPSNKRELDAQTSSPSKR